MSQTYPQFTPVQILEAGQRAFGEGRTDYAAQFFQHLIEHYADTAEAASARDAMVQINGSAPVEAHQQPGPAVRASQRATQTAPQAQPRQMQHGAGPAPMSSRPAPGHVQPLGTNGVQHGAQLSINGAAGHHHDRTSTGHASASHTNGHTPNGYATAAPAANGQAPFIAQRHNDEPMLAPAPLTPSDAPHQIARNGDAALYERGTASRPGVAAQRMFVPAPEKNYIIGRVIAGLLLIIGIIGILAGIILVYAALTDPGIFAAIGIATPAQALVFSCSVFVGSVIALIGSQMATAVFDGADAATDLARIERYRFGDVDDE